MLVWDWMVVLGDVVVTLVLSVEVFVVISGVVLTVVLVVSKIKQL